MHELNVAARHLVRVPERLADVAGHILVVAEVDLAGNGAGGCEVLHADELGDGGGARLLKVDALGSGVEGGGEVTGVVGRARRYEDHSVGGEVGADVGEALVEPDAFGL